MIKKLLTIAALALPLMAANAQESVEKVVFEEDFSLMTKGEVGNPDTETTIVEDGAIKPEYTHKPGWTAASAQSAGGSIRLETGVYLYSPVLALSASVDGEITVEFDVYAENTAGRGADFVYIQQVMGSEQNQIAHMFVAEEWTHVVFSTNKDKTCEPNKNFASIPSNGVMQLGFKSAWNAIYIKNLKVTINVDPNAEVGESTDFAGTYTFKATKEITAPNAQEAKALWVQDEFDFTITANEGDDAEVYPFLLNNFPTSKKDDGSIVAYNAIKAKPSADGKSLVLAIGHAGKLQSGSDHPELAGPNGKDDTATELVMSPIADSENYTIEGGFQVINHTEEQWGGIIPASWRNLAKLDDIVITRTADVDGIDEIVVDEVEKAEKKAHEGVYTINGAKVRNTNDATGLQPGFYIIGGEKVIIR